MNISTTILLRSASAIAVKVATTWLRYVRMRWPGPQADLDLIRLNRSGQSIIQVLVSMGILSILLLVMTSMFGNQNREVKALKEQLALADFQRSLNLVLGSGQRCTEMLTKPGNAINPASLTFNPAGPFPTINLNSIPMDAAGDLISAADHIVSTYSNSVKVLPQTGIQIQVTSATLARLLINFDQAGLIRPVKNMSVPITIKTTPAGGNVTLSECQGGNGGTGGPALDVQVFDVSGTWTKPSVGGTTAVIECWGGGGGGGTGSAGGGGGYSIVSLPVSMLSDTETVVVGRGGAPVAGWSSQATSGGTSHVGAYAYAGGGDFGYTDYSGGESGSYRTGTGGSGSETGGNGVGNYGISPIGYAVPMPVQPRACAGGGGGGYNGTTMVPGATSGCGGNGGTAGSPSFGTSMRLPAGATTAPGVPGGGGATSQAGAHGRCKVSVF